MHVKRSFTYSSYFPHIAEPYFFGTIKSVVCSYHGHIIYMTALKLYGSQRGIVLHVENGKSHRQSFFHKLLTGLLWGACPIYWRGTQLSADRDHSLDTYPGLCHKVKNGMWFMGHAKPRKRPAVSSGTPVVQIHSSYYTYTHPSGML